MKIRFMALCALFAALMCLCAWLSIPTPVGVISMQTFGLFLTLGVLGGQKGCLVCLLYLLLGAVGLPVFTGFRGGIGVLLGPTGGYIGGFLVGALVYWTLTSLKVRPLPAMICSQLVCYLCGTVWYKVLFPQTGLWAVMLTCILPYLIPDAFKIALAFSLSGKLARFINPPSRT